MSNSVSFCQHLFLILHSSHCSLSLHSCTWWTLTDCLTPPGDFEFSESRNSMRFTHIVGIPPVIVRWTHSHKQGRQRCRGGVRQSVPLGPMGSLTVPIFLFLSYRHVSPFSVSPLSLGSCDSFKPAKATSEEGGYLGSCVGVGGVPLNWEVAAGGTGTLVVTSRGRLLLSLARVSQGQQQPKATKTDFQSPPKSCISRLPQTIAPCAPGHGASSTLKAVSTEPHSVGFKLWGKLAASLWVFLKTS